MTTSVTRFDLQQLQGITPKLIQFFEQLFVTGQGAADAVKGITEGTGAIQNATVLTLSSNAAFNNERILALDPDSFVVTDNGSGNTLAVALVVKIIVNGGYALSFNLDSDTNLDLPTEGRVLTDDFSGLGNYADDAAAAAGGVPVGGLYRTSNAVKVRIA